MPSSLLAARQTIVFEGDSLTRRALPPSADNWPLLRMNNWHHSWADLVEEWIFAHRPDLQIKTRQAAIGGSTIAGLESRYEAHVKPHRPSWIFLTLGTNDAAQGIPLDDFRTRLAAYIKTAANDSGARFFYAGGFLPMPCLPEDGVNLVTKAQLYYEAAREAVRASGGLAPEIAESMKEKAEQHIAASEFHTFYSDGVHLNSLGNHVLAGIILQHLGVFA